MFWPYFCSERLKLNPPSACKQKVLEYLHCSSRTHSGSIRYSIRAMNQKPSLSSFSFFFQAHSFSECVSEGSTHDIECVQPATAERAVHDLLSHLACYQNTFFSFHTSLRAVSTVLFSWILSCAFKPVKSKKSLLIWHIQALNGKPPPPPYTWLLLYGNDSSTKQFRECATAVSGKTLLLNTYNYSVVDGNGVKMHQYWNASIESGATMAPVLTASLK